MALATKLPVIPSLVAEWRQSIFGHIWQLPRGISASQSLHLSIEFFTGWWYDGYSGGCDSGGGGGGNYGGGRRRTGMVLMVWSWF